MATAAELFEARHYPGVVALVSDALEDEPECVPLLLVRARAHMALRRDLDAQADLRDIIRLDPQCSLAYRLLGELAARRDENESAAIFFREALRLDPGDREAQDWLAIVCSSRPAAVASKLPAPAAAAGRFPRMPSSRESAPRFAKGTHSPDDERPTARRQDAVRVTDAATEERVTRRRMAVEPEQRVTARFVGVRADAGMRAEAPPMMRIGTYDPREGEEGETEPDPLPPPPPRIRVATGSSPELAPYRGPEHPARPERTVDLGPSDEHRTLQGAQPVRRPLTHARSPIPELPGFGDYLVSTGILTRERLRAAQAYQRSMKVQLATAIVTLGLATPQRIEWAAVAHQSQVARGY